MTTFTAATNGQRRAGILTPEQSWTLIVYCRWYEIALGRHGFTTERLELLARKIANDALRLRGATLQERFDDLVSRLVIVGLQASLRFDPEHEMKSYGSRGGDPFESYVSDVMGKRVDDYFRSKAEGFGDRRYGNDDRIVLTDDFDSPEPVSFDIRDNERARWQKAAQAVNQDLDQWIVNSLNRAARQDMEVAA